MHYSKPINQPPILFWMLFLMSLSIHSHGQDTLQVQGRVTDQNNKEPISYATVTLHAGTDSSLIAGTISNANGQFILSPVPQNRCYLRVSFIGYQPVNRTIDGRKATHLNLGTIPLQQADVLMQEALVTADRLPAKTSHGTTTFYVNQKMNSVANSGIDILRHLPGIQVDLMQNLTLDGSSNIIIRVDGQDRDPDYLRQINARQIDKIEVIRTPGPQYDASVTGVLNIILKERDTGISGHVYAELPTSSSVFLNPSYSLNYGHRKMNIYTSYNGSIRYFDVTENNIRELATPSEDKTYHSFLSVRQKTNNHRFHYGMDFFLNKQNQLNFYSYFNPYSQELDGSMEMASALNQAQAKREETDHNYRGYYSVFYKHLFHQPEQSLTLDLNFYHLKTDNALNYNFNAASGVDDILNHTQSRQYTAGLRLDYTTPLHQTIQLNTGWKSHWNNMQDPLSTNFDTREDVHAIYFDIAFQKTAFHISAGLRSEYATISNANDERHHDLALLPHAQVSVPVTTKQQLQLTFRRSIQRPRIYQLHPALTVIDPVTVERGNAVLEPAYSHELALSYSLHYGSQYLSTKLYCNTITDAIQRIGYINASEMLETTFYNVGTMTHYGIHLTGSLRITKNIALSPYFKLYHQQTSGNALMNNYRRSTRTQWIYESGCSGRLTLKHDLAASVMFQYNSPASDLQNTRYSDALYFISLEKTFSKHLNAGVAAAVPFTRTFNFSGHKSKGPAFFSRTEGYVHLPSGLILLHLRYQFNRGKKVETIKRQKEQLEQIRPKGF